MQAIIAARVESIRQAHANQTELDKAEADAALLCEFKKCGPFINTFSVISIYS